MAFLKLTKFALLAATACVPGQVWAQQGQAPEDGEQAGIEDIVVTARRTSESSQAIPISITNVSESALKYNVVQSVNDLTTQAGSLRITNGTSSPAGLTINMRGQTQTGSASNDTSSVGVYLNDLFLSSAQISGSVINLQDLERVEVLKGAQGTLYGRNVTAGVVKFVTKKPSQDFELSLTGGLGSFDRRFAAGVVNVPLGETAAVRVVGSIDNRGGFSKDIGTGREADNQKKWNVRGAFSWKPTDKFSVLLEGSYGRYSSTDSDVRTTFIQPGLNIASMNIIAAQGINGLNAGSLAPLILGAAAGFTPAQIGAAAGAAIAALPQVNSAVALQLNAPRSQARSLSRFETPSKTRAGNAALTLGLELGDATIKSITGYDYGSTDRDFNVGGGPWIPLLTNQNGVSKHWTQELQLTGTSGDRLSYSAGLFYMDRTGVDNREDSSEFGAFPLFLGQFGLRITNGSTQQNETNTKSYAGYAQATYELVNNLKFTGGIRYTKEDVSVVTSAIQKPQASTGFQTRCIGPAPTTAATPLDKCFGGASDSFSAWTYTAGLDYTLAEDVLVYAKTSRGFKSGGLNVFTGAGAAIQSYKPETTQDFETGLKSRFFDRRLLLNLTYYHTDYSNIQRAVAFDAGGGTILTATRNAAAAKIDGVEGEMRVVLFDGMTLGGNVSYTDAGYEDYFITAVRGGVPTRVDLSGVPFEGLSKWTYSLSAGYDKETPLGNFHAQLNWTHRSAANLFENDSYGTDGGAATPLAETSQPGFGLLDGSISLDIDKLNSTVTLWSKNMLDKRYKQGALSLSNVGVPYTWSLYGAPATYGIDLTVRF